MLMDNGHGIRCTTLIFQSGKLAGWTWCKLANSMAVGGKYLLQTYGYGGLARP